MHIVRFSSFVPCGKRLPARPNESAHLRTFLIGSVLPLRATVSRLYARAVRSRLRWRRPFLAAAALGGAAKRLFDVRKYDAGDLAMRLTAYCIIPVWIGVGFLDKSVAATPKSKPPAGWRRVSCISLMMLEASPPVLAPLFLEINSGVPAE